MIGIWYNSNKDQFYTKYVRTAFFSNHYKVGYINQYNHKLVALFMIEDKRLISCNSWDDYFSNKKKRHQLKYIKKRFIKYLIEFLERRV